MQCPDFFSLSLDFFLNRAAQFINKLVMLPWTCPSGSRYDSGQLL